MDKRYHLIIENARVDHTHMNPAITLTLVDTMDFNPVFEMRTSKEYQPVIEELVFLKFRDNVRVYDRISIPQRR